MGRRTPLYVAAALSLSLVTAPAWSQEKEDAARPPAPTGGAGNSGGQRAPDSRYLGRLLIGDDAPDFFLPTMDGSTFRLRLIHGLESVAILFLQRPDEDLTPYALVGDSLRQNGIRVLFVFAEREQQASRPWSNLWVLYDRKGEVARLYGAYDVITGNIVPAVFLVDRIGHVRFLAAGILPDPKQLSELAYRVLVQEWHPGAIRID